MNVTKLNDERTKPILPFKVQLMHYLDPNTLEESTIKMQQQPHNPFKRPWMRHNGAADSTGKASGLRGMIAGAITGAIEICVTYPTEFVKTELQLDREGSKGGGSKRYSGIMDCIRQTVHSRGYLGLYRGLSVLLYGSIPKSSVRFGTFEYFKSVQGEGSLTPKQTLLCGFGAGFCEAILVVTPMESIKVKFINDQRTGSPRYRGFAHGVKLIVKELGIKGLYQGLTATVLKQGSNQAIRFMIVEQCKAKYLQGKENSHVPKAIVGLFGVLAGAASVYANNPIDVVKTRLQSLDSNKYKGTADCFIQILREEGPAAFYKGAMARMSRVCLDVGITFMVYDTIMDFLNEDFP